jgi:transketolase
MRKEFSQYAASYLLAERDAFFLTGDLGYAALENVREKAGERFINAGVAEQNMIGVAAGMAYTGLEVFVYSIAPFVVYRSLEQVRLDVCIHDLPVYLVGNGGGYGYGIMGATHHAIEDIACLSGLPNMTCWVPAFKEDVKYCFERMTDARKPAYLRLGSGVSHAYPNGIGDINLIVGSGKPRLTVAVMGPVVQNAWEAIGERGDIDLFTFLNIPVPGLSEEFLKSLGKTRSLLVIEEHVRRGGFGEHLVSRLIDRDSMPDRVRMLHAVGYPSGAFGSQGFHQKESGLDPESIRRELNVMVL